MRIKAAVLHQIGAPAPYARSQPIKIETLELDPPGEGEVLLEVKAAGICHSDLSAVDGTRPRPVPLALGHEAAGIIKEVGPGVHDLAPGDHVVPVFMASCGRCDPCLEGRPVLCERGGASNVAGTLLSGARRLKLDGVPVHHHLGVSAFADHAVVSRNSCVKIDKALPFEIAALFGCGVITGMGAVLNTARARPGAKIAVIGLGGVGLNSVLAARVAGARQLIAIDLREDKLALARELGATHTFNAGDGDLIEKVRAVSGGGVDYAVEAAGAVPALEIAWKITRRGGETVAAGLPHASKTASIPASQLVGEERVLKGSYIGSTVPGRDIPAYIELYRAGRLPVDRLMSDRIGLDDINAAFDRLAAGDVVRQVVVF